MSFPFPDNTKGLDQRSMSGSVPLEATDEEIEARIIDVIDAARVDLARHGALPPYSAPPLPTNCKPQFYGDYLKIARYSDEGLRIVVQVVLDIEHKPWYIGVRTDAFIPALDTQKEKTCT